MDVSSPDPVIAFPCPCGHAFRVSADRAASSIQCPACGRLNDVPTLTDLASIADDGTLMVTPLPTRPEPKRVVQAFGPRRKDAASQAIDLRNTQDDLEKINAPRASDQIPLTADDARPAKPKYDPITGELIRPLKLARDPVLDRDPKTIPVARSAHSLTYAAGETALDFSAFRVLVDLFMPANIAVMFFVFLGYFAYQLVVGMVGWLIFTTLGLMPTFYNAPLALFLMAHYANTVEDTGPDAFDELPRPLRSMSPMDDVWHPFCAMLLALGVCFLPAVACLYALPPQYAALAVLPAGVGTFFFPAAFLTAVTGGTSLNLRPDRLAGVIRASAAKYTLCFAIWLVALPLFAYSLFGVYLIPYAVREDHPWIYQFNRPVLMYPVTFASIILMHWGSWLLGLIYRRHHNEFPWVLQHHVSSRRRNEAAKAAEIRAARRKPRYVK